jgi:anti-sigma B factor antagonist
MTNMVTEQSGKLIVGLEGEFDLEHSPAIRKLLLDAVARGRQVIVDLARVSYIDSSGIANLVEALQAANRQKIKLCLAGVGAQVRRVLTLARLDKVFLIHDDLAAALSAAD